MYVSTSNLGISRFIYKANMRTGLIGSLLNHAVQTFVVQYSSSYTSFQDNLRKSHFHKEKGKIITVKTVKVNNS